MDNLVIAISREFGSGGRLIGEKIAKALDISYYDKVLLQLAAERSGLSPEFIEKSEEQASSSFLFNLSTVAYGSSNFFYQYDVPVNDKAFYAQASVVRELAEKESCVIVGRCADHILKAHKRCIKVFIFAPYDLRLDRIINAYNVPANEAEERMRRIDKGRANYYRHYTGETWGEVRSHDLCINTGITGVDGAVEIIKKMVQVMNI